MVFAAASATRDTRGHRAPPYPPLHGTVGSVPAYVPIRLVAARARLGWFVPLPGILPAAFLAVGIALGAVAHRRGRRTPIPGVRRVPSGARSEAEALPWPVPPRPPDQAFMHTK